MPAQVADILAYLYLKLMQIKRPLASSLMTWLGETLGVLEGMNVFFIWETQESLVWKVRWRGCGRLVMWNSPRSHRYEVLKSSKERHLTVIGPQRFWNTSRDMLWLPKDKKCSMIKIQFCSLAILHHSWLSQGVLALPSQRSLPPTIRNVSCLHTNSSLSPFPAIESWGFRASLHFELTVSVSSS